MVPRVRYVTTADGVHIALSALGEGPSILEMPPMPFRHLHRSWQFPEERSWFERLGRGRRLVQYDPRGLGLSQREVADFSGDGLLLDLEAVIDEVGATRIALLAYMTSGALAIAYAARHPERVSHLILWSAAPRLLDTVPREFEAMIPLIETNWELFTEATMRAYRGWADTGDAAHRQALFLRECVNPPIMRALMELARETDVTPLLPSVRCPTLVLHARTVPWVGLDLARKLAAAIPGARLTIVEGAAPFGAEMESAARIIDEFLEDTSPASSTSAAEPKGLAIILFTDLADSTALTARLGDARARDVLRAYERIVRDALHTHRGAEVKALGDGFMATFSSASRALDCAVAMQRVFATTHQAEFPMRVRIGLNAGEPVAEAQDLFGTAVNLAARIAAHATPGQILVSDVVRQLAAGKTFTFTPQSPTTLRGFEDPVQLHEVTWTQ
jgi:class 3 adenylate cyclase/pimeloyl-ACP methyl ester carboxylesterase